jgi:hypothetical protein
MTKTNFTAYGVIRTSDNDYPFASRDHHGAVRFHQTRQAAERFPNYKATRRISAAEARAVRKMQRDNEARAQRVRDERRAADAAKVEECMRRNGDWRSLYDELRAARIAEGL